MKFAPAAAIVSLAALILLPSAQAAEKRLLFFSKSGGFEHEAIKLAMKDGRRGYAFSVMEKIGREDELEITFSKDGSKFSPDYLAQFDGIMFYTTNDLLHAKGDPKTRPGWEAGDNEPAMTSEGVSALLAAVRHGKAFVGVHSASDTLHTPGQNEFGPARYRNDGDKTSDYIKLVGGEFVQHGAQQPSRLRVVDPHFPGADAIPTDRPITEEWYSLKNFAPDLHVILLNDTADMKGFMYDRPPYPSTWAHHYGKGRVFYTSLGHREDIWTSAFFQHLLTGGINWALGRVEANTSPNLLQTAPGADQLPAYQPPRPK